MALQEVPGDITGKVGAVETIQIVPGAIGVDVTITSVLYGTNAAGPIKVKLNNDHVSFDLTILSGNNLLQVVLFSPDKVDGNAIAQQTNGGGVSILEDDIEFVGGLAVWTPEILGA